MLDPLPILQKGNNNIKQQQLIQKQHKAARSKLYVSIRDNSGWDNWKMIVICDYPCNNKREAELEEDRYMMELKANMNMKRASRTIKEWREDNKDKIKEQIKQYREDNKENIKDKIKEYYEANKEQIRDQQTQYQEINKDKLNENKSKKCICECGAIIQHCMKTRHKKTMKHQKYLNTIEHSNGVV
jgi:hypothetical protein